MSLPRRAFLSLVLAPGASAALTGTGHALACLEVATATTLAAALTGRRVHLVCGARPLPNEAHAWVTTPGTGGRRACP